MAYFARQNNEPVANTRPQRRHMTQAPSPAPSPPPSVEAPKVFEGKNEQTGGTEAVTKTSSTDILTAKSTEALAKLRLTLKKRGCHGIITLGKKFRSMDDDGSGTLCYEEFKKAMKEMKFNESELQALFRFFDADCSGSISYNEFITGLRGEMNERRKGLVMMAYKVMDKNGDGTVDMQDMISRYDASNHPDVISGKKTKFEVVREFMDTFDGGEKDGIISPTEFSQYYSGVSANVDNDDYFELMIRNAWHISGGTGWCENTTCKRVLVTHEDGTQTVEEIKDDIDIGKDDKEAMKANLANQGIKAANIDTTGNANQATPAAPIHPTQPGGGRNRSDLYGNRAKQTQSSIIF